MNIQYPISKMEIYPKGIQATPPHARAAADGAGGLGMGWGGKPLMGMFPYWI